MTQREAQLTRQLEECREALSASTRENALLRQKIDWLIRRVFGSSSEQLDRSQLELLLGLPQPEATPELPMAPAKAERTVAPKRERAPRLPENLPVVEEVIDPEPVKAAPEDWRCIGQEVSEQLDYEPARFLRRRLVRRKFVHRRNQDHGPVIADLPARLLHRGIAAPGLLAQIIVSKYCDHLPLYRQEQIYRSRHGVLLPRQTLVRWMELAADWLKPIYQQIRTGVMAGGYVQGDETPIEYLDPGHGRTRKGFFWTFASPKGDVVFQWETSRAAACLEKVVPIDFSGVIQCDGYSAYPAFASGRKQIRLAGCWAHVRRKFFEASTHTPRVAGWFLGQIGQLYRVEAMLRQEKAGPQLRQAIRCHQSTPVVERLGRAMRDLKLSGRYLPQSAMGKALDYALSIWPTLGLFLDEGRLEIDNNLVENAIRPTAVGKKNWLFIGEADAGNRGAILYTIVECCRRRNLDPYAYLRDVLTRLPRMTNWQIPEITPAAWAKHLQPLLKAAS